MNQDNLFVIKTRRIPLLLVFCSLSIGLWLIFAKLAVPLIIEGAYRGESLSFLNSIIEGQAQHPVDHYLQVWDRITIFVALSGFAFCLLAIVMSSQTFFLRFVGEATPGSLGAIRMWTCTILLASTLWEDLSSIALLPLEYREPLGMGLMKLLDVLPTGYQFFLTSETSLRAFQWLTELALLFGAIGWRTRVFVPLAAFCAFILNGILRDYSFFWHQNLVPIYVLAVLSFTPCGDGWSMDRLRQIYQGRPVPNSDRASAVYGWARYACWVPIALTYAAAGLSKLRNGGLFWVDPTNMRNMLYEQTLYPRTGNWSISLHLASAPDIVFVLLGIAAIFSELIFVTVLFSRTARWIVPAMTILMHIGIVFLQNILFLDLILLQLIFYDLTRTRKALGDRLRGAGPIQVLYDGLCPLCRRTVRLLRSLDLFRRLEFEDFRGLDLADYKRSHALDLTHKDLEKEMYVISRDQAFRGFYGYRALALALPALWPLAPLLFLPGIAPLGASVYGYIARNRRNILMCDSNCQTEPSRDDVSIVIPLNKSAWYSFAYGLAIAGLTVVMASVWVQQIEFYPFTAVQMFTEQRKSVVTYFKTIGRRESGLTSPFYLEDTIAFMSINSRYEPLFDLCFGTPNKVEICRKTLAILGSAYNKRARPGEKVTHLEIQRWKWDFGARPRDPSYGDLEARLIAEVTAGRPAQRNLTPVSVTN